MEHFISLLASLLCVLTVSYIISSKLRFPVIPIYIVAGIVFSLAFHVHEPHIFEVLGVILLLFFIGLEFSIAELEKNLRAILSVGFIDLVFNTLPVFLVAKLLGFDSFTSLVISVVLYPSSSAIVSKLLIDLKKLANPEVETVLSILVFEDIAAAVLLAILMSFSGGAPSPEGVVKVLIKVSLFIAIAFIAIKNLNKFVDYAFKTFGSSTEFTVLFTATVLFLAVEVTFGFGLSESIGAFVAGMLFAESSYKEQIESVVIPYRDLFGALFFLAFGLSIDLTSFSTSIVLPLTVLLIISFVAKIATGIVAVRLYKLGTKRGLSAGLMLLPRGEFSILVAATKPELVPLTAAYVLLSASLGSIAMKESGRILNLFFKKKPKKKSKLTRSQLLGD
ncbi:cation:proton antiporter [Phorcysia thermohydrogeniphila]|nr:cation:proton antiporter [Phorcysia thermohydrogeniphila]